VSTGDAAHCQEVCVVVGLKCSRCVEGIGQEETMKEMEMEHVGKLECVSKFFI
jgi:hypothetical protein